jgi:GTPase SAR1 family protein
MILVGNKSDIGVGRQVSVEAGEQKAAQYEMSFCETSAKVAKGVEEMFHSIIENIRVNKSGEKSK